jgi:polysaccharide export outer membrane protein
MERRRLNLVLFALCFATNMAACAPSRLVKQSVVYDDPPAIIKPYRVEPDDVLDVMVWKQPQLSGNVAVAADGTITVPLIDSVRAAGLTTAQLRTKITRRLAPFIANPTVTVSVADARSQVIYVMGSVRRPGIFRLRPGEVLSQVLAEAGGFTEFADPDAITITRHKASDASRLVINFDRVMRGDLSGDVPLVAGDTINVP